MRCLLRLSGCSQLGTHTAAIRKDIGRTRCTGAVQPRLGPTCSTHGRIVSESEGASQEKTVWSAITQLLRIGPADAIVEARA